MVMVLGISAKYTISQLFRNCLIRSNNSSNVKNLGRLWLAYSEVQGDFTCYNSYLLTLGTKDMGMLWHHQLMERIMGSYQLEVPFILMYLLVQHTFTPCMKQKFCYCVGWLVSKLDFLSAFISSILHFVKKKATKCRTTCKSCKILWHVKIIHDFSKYLQAANFLIMCSF